MISDKEKVLVAAQQAVEQELDADDVDNGGFQSSPEHVTDDEQYAESDFQPMEKFGDEDQKCWEAEECIDVEDEESLLDGIELSYEGEGEGIASDTDR